MNVQDIYMAMDRIAPFSTQEPWDNSGLLVGSPQCPASRVLVTLDISVDAVEAAHQQGCDVIVSHHPVIFSPLKRLACESPVYRLAKYGIAAICSHTPLDIAEGGINDSIVSRLRTKLDATAETELLDAAGCGRILTLREPVDAQAVAAAAKAVLHCPVVRCFGGETPVRRLGICSGSGASMLEETAGRCDALLTGDVKHDRWYKAQELGMSLIDCGHYWTEVLMVEDVAARLKEALPPLEVVTFRQDNMVQYL